MKTQHKTTGKGVLEVVENAGRNVGAGTTVLSPKTPGKGKQKSSRPSEAIARPAAVLTHELIAERARAVWLERGCPLGQDESNWQEAETQLRRELGPER